MGPHRAVRTREPLGPTRRGGSGASRTPSTEHPDAPRRPTPTPVGSAAGTGRSACMATTAQCQRRRARRLARPVSTSSGKFVHLELHSDSKPWGLTTGPRVANCLPGGRDVDESGKVNNDAVASPFRLNRRQVFQAAGLVGLLEFVSACSRSTSKAIRTAVSAPAGRGHVVFSDHQFLVLEAATARLIPGPMDDPSEMGHPGAREAGVANYIDRMLGALSAHPARIYAGGPFSERNGASGDDMANFIALDAGAVPGLDSTPGEAPLAVCGRARGSRPRGRRRLCRRRAGRPGPRAGQEPGRVYEPHVQPRHRGDVLGARVRRKRRLGRVARHRLPRRRPAGRLQPGPGVDLRRARRLPARLPSPIRSWPSSRPADGRRRGDRQRSRGVDRGHGAG